MRKIFRLNSYFEEELKFYPEPVVLNKNTIQRNSLLEKLFFLVADKNDFVLTTNCLNPKMFEYWNEKGIEFAEEFCRKFSDEKLEFIEWGKTSDFVNSEILYNPIKIGDSKQINSKIFQGNIKIRLEISPLEIFIVKDFQSIQKILADRSATYILKPEFNFSGKDTKILRNKNDVKSLEKIFSNSDEKKYVLEELAENRIRDFSGIFSCSHGMVKNLAITEMIISKTRAYIGSIIELEKEYSFFNALCETVQDFVNTLPVKYEGSLSADGFEFIRDGERDFQLVSEINFRYSMGRVLYDLIQKYPSGYKVFGLHFFRIVDKSISEKVLLSLFSKLEKDFQSFILAVTPFQNIDGNIANLLGLHIASNSRKDLDLILESLKKYFKEC
ncbi:MAG: hypothetical protein L6Q54_07525 [Leptospiraceae bacterium]|nr:hypothetical protein [Leptospiraceae bacterium]MCK6381084.1 hypothetical protein [Leptospiraceae bacterium]NUM42203.1 hypothetical protein [Leptospiraceae bacterium]